jgi:hypothetical protein
MTPHFLQVGKAALPDNINRIESKRLTGPHVLQVGPLPPPATHMPAHKPTSHPMPTQVASAADISQPSRFQDAGHKGRMLRLMLTDGKINCVAVEYVPLGPFRGRGRLQGGGPPCAWDAWHASPSPLLCLLQVALRWMPSSRGQK